MSILGATIANYLRLGVTAAAQLLLVPAMLRHLGTDDYGLYSLVVSSVSLFALLEFGANVGALRAVGAAEAVADRGARNAALSTVLALSAAIALLALGLLCALLPWAPGLLKAPEDRRHELQVLLFLFGLRSAVLPWPLGVFRGALMGRGDVGLANAIQAAGAVLYALAALLLLPAGIGLVGIGALSLAAFLVEHAAYAFFAVRRLPGLRLRPALVNRRDLRTALSLGGAQSLIALSGLLLLKTDPLIVAWQMPLAAVAAYTVALRIAEQAFSLVKQFVNALPPFIVRADGRGDRAGLARMLVLGVRASLVPAGLVALPLAAFPGELIGAWVGPQLAMASGALGVLSVAMALMAPQLVISSLLTYTGRHATTSRIALVSAIVNVAASVALVGPLGLVGVSLGTLFAVVSVDVLVAGRAAARAFGVPLATLWGGGLLRGLLPVVPAAALAAALKQWTVAPTIPSVLVHAAAVDLVFLVAFFFLGLEAERRAAVWSRLLRVLRPSRPEAAPAVALAGLERAS